MDDFNSRNKQKIAEMNSDAEYGDIATAWFNKSIEHEYHYHFSWMGMPIIQFPQDIIIMQELVWQVKPDIIIETGIARGGSLIFYASLMELMGNKGKVIGIDIDIREHNKVAITEHPMYKNIDMIEGSSIDPQIVDKVRRKIKPNQKIMVVLDSNHTHDHVSKEIELYSKLVTKDSYLIVLDTVIEDIPAKFNEDRPWSKGNNPKTAVKEFLSLNKGFELDTAIEEKVFRTVGPSGFLKKIK